MKDLSPPTRSDFCEAGACVKTANLAPRAPAEHADFVHMEKCHGTELIWKQHGSSRQWIKIQPTDDLALAVLMRVSQWPEKA